MVISFKLLALSILFVGFVFMVKFLFGWWQNRAEAVRLYGSSLTWTAEVRNSAEYKRMKKNLLLFYVTFGGLLLVGNVIMPALLPYLK